MDSDNIITSLNVMASDNVVPSANEVASTNVSFSTSFLWRSKYPTVFFISNQITSLDFLGREENVVIPVLKRRSQRSGLFLFGLACLTIK